MFVYVNWYHFRGILYDWDAYSTFMCHCFRVFGNFPETAWWH